MGKKVRKNGKNVTQALDQLQAERNRVGARHHEAYAAHPNKEPIQPLVVIMTPAISHEVTTGYHKSHVETVALLSQNGWGSSWQSFGGDPYLSKVRNLHVSECLRRFPTASHLFFIDADVEWNAEDVLKFVQHPGDIIAGVYPKKNDVPDFPASLMADKETGKFVMKDGLHVGVMVPTGFLCVRRQVYEAMAAKSYRYRDSMSQNTICWNIFEMGFCLEKQPDDPAVDGQWWGEDPAWCRKVIDMGYDILVDVNANFGHRGQKTWRYKFSEFVGAYERGEAKVIERSPPGAETKRVFVEPPAGVSPLTAAVEPEAVPETHGAASLAAD